jgi:hypothetical protein
LLTSGNSFEEDAMRETVVDEAATVRFRSADLTLCGRVRLSREAAPLVVLLSGLGFHTFEYEPLVDAG